MTDALVERLRARTVKSPAADFNPFVSRTMPDPDCAEAAERISALSGENARLREALDEVARPMFHMRKRAEANGQRLGDMAYVIANSLNHVQEVARAALKSEPQQSKPSSRARTGRR